MFAPKPRGSRIVYVASSARELPEDFRNWLGQPDHRAANSPNIYDALARLASGARPTLLIVSIEGVDWSEMEFFDRAAHLSRETAIYVVGHEYSAAKLHAAYKRGARRFDPDAMQEDLSAPPPWSRTAGVSDILAGSLQAAKAPPQPPRSPLVKPVPPVPVELEESEEPSSADTSAGPPSVRLVPPATVDAEADAEPVDDSERSGAPIPFPWSPSPNRPQRIPPRAPGSESKASSPTAAQPGSAGSMPTPPRQSVELTADELAALMGRAVATETPVKEGLG